MSTKEISKQIIQLLDRLPAERLKHYSSFKRVQTIRFKKEAGIALTAEEAAPTEKRTLTDVMKEVTFKPETEVKTPFVALTADAIQSQFSSLKKIMDNKYQKYYHIPNDKLLNPKGNPDYYTRLLSELNGENKETKMSAARTVIFGR
ncbi:hypothetical protein BABINDRAFT_161320 [Babjeviella inositovora NRRL Y-12698]|uniref:Cytochrome B pre-mRNA-processing protein 6 n=1 Tax=Babjeviella inositovora NRRL Y-12698 TaxID=984486 RepID=A0A1E3QRT0_9ASCO|nr:uncharacterized protein BABINDRAFT_161320 [Babjeviella inositovora NRRL Y-12698]ODQ80370.1 hypothetical protein BABINDRAFT_161320 [Babjeviella inositovora NRRL Y-12698]